MSRFQIGTRVRTSRVGYDGRCYTGVLVAKASGYDGRWAVALKGFAGHSCGYHTPNNDGWWLFENEMTPCDLSEEEKKKEEFLDRVQAYTSRELS